MVLDFNTQQREPEPAKQSKMNCELMTERLGWAVDSLAKICRDKKLRLTDAMLLEFSIEFSSKF